MIEYSKLQNSLARERRALRVAPISGKGPPSKSCRHNCILRIQCCIASAYISDMTRASLNWQMQIALSIFF